MRAGVETDAIATTAVAESPLWGVSWAAIAAGAVANLAVTLAILSLGVGLGISVASPWGSAVSPTTFKIGTGIYFIVMAMLGASVGGYVAGRLRTKWTGVHSDEVYFRDTAHGFLSWATAAVVGVLLLSGPAALVAGGAASAPDAKTSAGKYASALLVGANPAQGQDLTTTHDQLATTLGAARGGALTDADRTYLQSVVAARAGLSPTDAGKRVSDVEAQMKSDLDTTRKTAAQLAIWLTLAMFAGAFCAALAATEGGGLRDGTWGRRVVPTTR